MTFFDGLFDDLFDFDGDGKLDAVEEYMMLETILGKSEQKKDNNKGIFGSAFGIDDDYDDLDIEGDYSSEFGLDDDFDTEFGLDDDFDTEIGFDSDFDDESGDIFGSGFGADSDFDF